MGRAASTVAADAAARRGEGDGAHTVDLSLHRGHMLAERTTQNPQLYCAGPVSGYTLTTNSFSPEKDTSGADTCPVHMAHLRPDKGNTIFRTLP